VKVLLISHTCQSLTEGQPRARELTRLGDIELQVLVPQRFNHFGTWREAEIPPTAEFSLKARRAAWPWLGPAQNYLHWYPSLPQILREFPPDIIDLWEENWSLCSAHACWLRNRILPRAKIVAETEQNLGKTLPPPFETLRSYVLRNADFCIGRSEEAVRVLRAKGFTGPAASVPNAVDAELFRPRDHEPCRAALKEYGIESTHFVAGYVGRLVEEKGVFDLVDALLFCPSNVRVLFVGDGPARARLEQHAVEKGLAQRVLFLPYRPLAELPALMNALDILVLPSRTTPRWKEQFGRVLIEAHACAVPAIGSHSGAIPDVIGQGGLVFSEGDARALAKALGELANDPAHAHELGRLGRQQVEQKYTWTRVAERMHEIYCDVLSVD
jgi:glycosyltransferase involved in cell wall biosynthesis